MSSSLTTVASYQVSASSSSPFTLKICQGSVLDYIYLPKSASAIVNAANEEMLGGGGVDGAISKAGGRQLYMDRRDVPEVRPGVRCPTGEARITGPNDDYGSLNTPYVVHAVGPNYHAYAEEEEADELLASAYKSSLDCGKHAKLEGIAFCLLSAGIFRGSRTLEEVLRIGLKSICGYEGYDELKEVVVCGFTDNELNALVQICTELGLSSGGHDASPSDEKKDTDEADENAKCESGENQPKTSPEQKDSEPKYDAKESKSEAKDEDTREDWEISRDEFKAKADNHFRAKEYPQATASYADALQLDPTNHIILSNKSGAHLANGEKSKALHDARKCVEHAPEWPKGYTRLAAAMESLGRYNEASKTYSKVLNELDPANAAAKKGLEICRARQQKQREEKEREARELQERIDREEAEKREKEEGGDASKEPKTEEDDLLDDFFSEVEQVSEKKPKKENAKPEKRIKEQLKDLGTSTQEIDRLLEVNYEWKNLNPFYVLGIPHQIDDESVISTRYRALSLLVHPDKCLDDPVRAKSAFEEVRKAMNMMNDTDKRRHVRALIDEGMKQGKRNWDVEKSEHGMMSAETEKQGLKDAQSKATMKIFAEIERKRRDVERRKRQYEQRERAQEDEERTKEKQEMEHDKKWKEKNRVEKRVGNWRSFQGGKKSKS